MPCEPHPHRPNQRLADFLVYFYPIRSYLHKKNRKTINLILRLFKKQRETSQPLVAIKPKP